MENIIETLYTYLSRPQSPDDPELEKIKEEYFKMCDLMTAHFGVGFMDRYDTLQDQIKNHKREREFFLGFQACAHLMLEVLEA